MVQKTYSILVWGAIEVEKKKKRKEKEKKENFKISIILVTGSEYVNFYSMCDLYKPTTG